MSNIIVLGSGMVGSAIALDLAKKHTVTVTDLQEKALQKISSRNKDINTQILDVTDHQALSKALKP
ncbi:MAG: saccharopine dehydrogenase NADP-binding domain-containing protein, partial [Fulvivirga sp.]|nr:saccharopine dehydrogenase NADP-binding domain-containing protein [Fulvivirga sp.]